jgi:hypothetical protein
LHGGEATKAVRHDPNRRGSPVDLPTDRSGPSWKIERGAVEVRNANAIGKLALEPGLPMVGSASAVTGDEQCRHWGLLFAQQVTPSQTTNALAGSLARAKLDADAAQSKAEMFIRIFRCVLRQAPVAVNHPHRILRPCPAKSARPSKCCAVFRATNRKRSRGASLDYAAQDDDWQLTDDQVAEVQRRTANRNRRVFSVAEARKRLRHLEPG